MYYEAGTVWDYLAWLVVGVFWFWVLGFEHGEDQP
jgi:hypothetical protein